MKTRYPFSNLAASEKTLLTCDQNQRITIDSIWCTNHDSSNRNIYLRHVPSGQADGSNFSIAFNQIIKSQTTTVFEGPFYMLPGDRLIGYATAANTIAVMVYADVT